MKAISFRSLVPGLLVACMANGAASLCQADWPFPLLRPDGAQRIDVIGPIGNRLPESYRRQYNRPTYLGGKTAAIIAPSSQEAMAWRRAEALGLYDNNGVKGLMHGKHCPPQRVEQHYFYPKPWEVLTVGPRQSKSAVTDETMGGYEEPVMLDENALLNEEAELVEEAETIRAPSPNELESVLPEPGAQDDVLDLNDQSSIRNPIADPVFVAPVSGLLKR
ncbi:hypothetical protein [Rhodopirellula halodulae]|uniref:hypothetical protein n=1 Tax=Rhodopirellula halodulae TaxID=2894198 RepID=UPI001E46234A|nr:hypothetical protein [Rhodopirellula sp. JC737]MCC9655555.1 hypothetical protein [Rhodopirellula sp. JC737]